jgi:hypothetical protein
MEKENQENKWSITAYGTKINLNKGEMVKYYANDKEKEDIVICTGRTQQSAGGGCLCGYSLGKCNKMGGLFFNLHKDNDGFDRFQSLRSHDSFVNNDPEYVYARKGIYLLCLEEPWLRKADNGICYYERYNRKVYGHYEGNEAIEEYNEDLSLCYKILLNKGKEWFGDVRNIAISMLGTGFKYWKNLIISKENTAENTAPVAVKSNCRICKKCFQILQSDRTVCRRRF